MPQPFFTGNYGASLAQVNTAPIERAGAAMGQAFQSIGTSIASAMEKHEKKKKEKEQEEATRVMLAGAFENNKEVAAAMGYPTDAEGQKVFLDAAAKNPNTMPTMTAFLNARALTQRLTQEEELHPVAKRTAEASAEVAELNLRLQQALEDGNLKLAKEIMGNKLMQAQAEKEFRELGGGSAETLKEMEDLKLKGAKTGIAKTEAQIGYYKSLGEAQKLAALAKNLEKTNPDVSKTMSKLSSQMENLLKTRYDTQDGKKTLSQIIDEDIDWSKGGKFSNPELQQALASHDALARQMSDAASSTQMRVRDKQTGDVVVMTVSEFLAKEAEDEAKRQFEKDSHELPDALKQLRQRHLKEIKQLEEELGIFNLGGI